MTDGLKKWIKVLLQTSPFGIIYFYLWSIFNLAFAEFGVSWSSFFDNPNNGTEGRLGKPGMSLNTIRENSKGPKDILSTPCHFKCEMHLNLNSSTPMTVSFNSTNLWRTIFYHHDHCCFNFVLRRLFFFSSNVRPRASTLVVLLTYDPQSSARCWSDPIDHWNCLANFMSSGASVQNPRVVINDL